MVITIQIVEYLVLTDSDKERKAFLQLQSAKIGLKAFTQIIDFLMAFILLDIIVFYINKKWEKEMLN